MGILNRLGRSPIGMVITADTVAVAQLARVHSSWRLAAAGILPRLASAPELTGEEAKRLSRFLTRMGFAGCHTVTGVPSKCLHMAVLDTPPRGSGAPVDEIAASELARMHGYAPEEAETLCHDLPPSPRTKGSQQVLALACVHSDAERLLESFDAAGLEVVALDSRPAALRRACVMAEGRANGAVLDMESDGATMIFLHQGAIVYIRNLPQAGLTALKANVADRLGLDAEAADCLLFDAEWAKSAGDEPVVGAAEVAGMVRSHLDKVIAEWRAPSTYVSQTYPDFEIGRLWIAGSGAAIVGAEEYLQKQLDIPVRTLRPSVLAECPKHLGRWTDDPRLTTALALARYKEGAA